MRAEPQVCVCVCVRIPKNKGVFIKQMSKEKASASVENSSAKLVPFRKLWACPSVIPCARRYSRMIWRGRGQTRGSRWLTRSQENPATSISTGTLLPGSTPVPVLSSPHPQRTNFDFAPPPPAPFCIRLSVKTQPPSHTHTGTANTALTVHLLR